MKKYTENSEKTHRRLNYVPLWHDQWKKYKVVPLDVGVSEMC
jgi:hypothetical protein